MLRRIWPPLAAFLLERAVIAAGALWAGHAPLAAASYARWDSGFYLDIAAHGYAPIFHCTPETHYAPADWCGNAGWYPGYPWAIAAVARTGLSPLIAAVLLAAVAQLACLFLIWNWTFDAVALGLAAFFPGNIYLAAVFPTALFCFFALLCLRACSSGRTGVAAAAGCGAALCHPLGVLLAPVVVLWALHERSERLLVVAAGVLAGHCLVLLAFHQQAGAWDAYYRIQAKYGYRVSSFVENLLAHLKPLVNSRRRDAKGLVGALQTLLCTVLLPTLLVRARKAGTPGTGLVALYVLAFWVAPLALGGQLSLYRAEALLLPATALVPLLPRRMRLPLLGAAVLISIPMSRLFFDGTLV